MSLIFNPFTGTFDFVGSGSANPYEGKIIVASNEISFRPDGSTLSLNLSALRCRCWLPLTPHIYNTIDLPDPTLIEPGSIVTVSDLMTDSRRDVPVGGGSLVAQVINLGTEWRVN